MNGRTLYLILLVPILLVFSVGCGGGDLPDGDQDAGGDAVSSDAVSSDTISSDVGTPSDAGDAVTDMGSPDCTDGDEELRDACGPANDGSLVYVCVDGAWEATEECRGASDCAEGDTQATSEACGLNGRGLVREDCVEGAWVARCDDPDVCTDGTERAGTTGCGDQMDGVVPQLCSSGSWVDQSLEACFFPGLTKPIFDPVGYSSGRFIAVSYTGRYVATLTSTSFDVADNDQLFDVYLRDRIGGTTHLISVSDQGETANTSVGFGTSSASKFATISEDGRWVAFGSRATNLGVSNPDGHYLAYLRDVQNQKTHWISSAVGGVVPDDDVNVVDMSRDGQFVLLLSEATNLVADDTNDQPDLFLYAQATGTLTRVSTTSSGAQHDGNLRTASMDDDAQWLAFQSNASNLGATTGSNTEHVWLKDLQTGQVELVSVDTSGTSFSTYAWSPQISGDGSTVIFYTSTTDLNATKKLWVRDLARGETHQLRQGTDGLNFSISADGTRIAFQAYDDGFRAGMSDDNQEMDVFLLEWSRRHAASVMETLTWMSLDHTDALTDYGATEPSISGDGRYVAFRSVGGLLPGEYDGPYRGYTRYIGDL